MKVTSDGIKTAQSFDFEEVCMICPTAAYCEASPVKFATTKQQRSLQFALATQSNNNGRMTAHKKSGHSRLKAHCIAKWNSNKMSSVVFQVQYNGVRPRRWNSRSTNAVLLL